MDVSRMERTFNFGPFIRIQLGTEIAVILAIYPLFLIFGDYRVALLASLLQYALRLGMTHAFAIERYRLGFDRGIASHALRFGLPILLNVLLLFAIFQGDRMIVANRLGLTDLAVFSLAFMLTLMPANVLAQTQQRLFLPKLAPLQDRPEAFARHARVVIESGLFIGLLVAVGFALFGPDLVLILFGHKYDAALLPLIWLGVMQAVRIAKSGASVVALARGETWNPTVANLARALTLPLAFLAVSHGAGLLTVIWIAIAGESLGLIVAFHLLRRLIRLPLHGLGVPFLLWGLCLGAICVYTVFYPPGPEVFGNFHSAQLILIVPLLAAFLGMSDLRNYLLVRLRG
jgi:O-antigen/teichoic acid export membrane protein